MVYGKGRHPRGSFSYICLIPLRPFLIERGLPFASKFHLLRVLKGGRVSRGGLNSMLVMLHAAVFMRAIEVQWA
jgi:hypothetical protein